MIFESDRVIAAVSRRPANMSLAYGDTSRSLTNRQAFLHGLDIPLTSLVCGQQVHTDTVAVVKAGDRGRGARDQDTAIPATDALVTNERNVPLGIFTADCLSVFLFDPVVNAIGLVHAGWRSSKQRISAKAVQVMCEALGCQCHQIKVAFGPALHVCCYEVQADCAAHFPRSITRRSGKLFLDLLDVNRRQLLQAGVLDQNIGDRGACTGCQGDDYFSFRREGASCGRMMSVIIMR